MANKSIFSKDEVSDLMKRLKQEKQITERDYETIEEKKIRKQQEKESFEKRAIRRVLREQEPIENVQDDYDDERE